MNNKFYRKATVAGITLLLIFALVSSVKKNSPAEAAPASTIFFNPPAISASNDQFFALEAKINPGTNQVTAVEVHVSYDATRLEIVSIAGGPSFPSVLQAGQFNNSSGTASIIVGVAPSNPPAPITTETIVATFNFHVIGQSGSSNVTFDSTTMAAAIGEPGDVITTRNYAQVTIGRTYNNADFAALASDWLKTMEGSPADVNTDGTINSKDLGIMMSNWEN